MKGTAEKTQLERKIQPEKRVSVKLYIREKDRLRLTKAVHTLKTRGWRRDKAYFRIQDKIIDELFSKANETFYENIINQLTPLEYLCQEGMKNPSIRTEIEKVLKRKSMEKK